MKIDQVLLCVFGGCNSRALHRFTLSPDTGSTPLVSFLPVFVYIRRFLVRDCRLYVQIPSCSRTRSKSCSAPRLLYYIDSRHSRTRIYVQYRAFRKFRLQTLANLLFDEFSRCFNRKVKSLYTLPYFFAI